MTRATWAVLTALVLAATACSGGTSTKKRAPGPATSTTAQASPTKEAFVLAADGACVLANQRYLALPKPRTTGDLQDQLRQQAAIAHDEEDALRAIPPPPGDESTVAAFFDQVHRFATALESLDGAITSKDRKAYAAARKELVGANTDAGRQARAYGLSRCGGAKPPSTRLPAGRRAN